MKAIVNATICPLMLHPSYESELADEALFGMTVEVLGSPCPGWHRVRTHYRYEGFAPDECLLFGDTAAARWAVLKKRTVTKGYCTVLSVPKVQGFTMVSLTRGAVVAVHNVPTGDVGPDEDNAPDEDGWQCVTLPNGWQGYTKSGFLGEYYETPPQIPSSALRERIVASALSYLGTHYRWGGKSTLGIDCSGLTSMAYLLNGIVIYRDARIAEGFPVREIDRAEMGPADLLFFPGHTALYIGQDKFIHATAQNGSDGVVVSSLNPADPDYRADLAASITAVGSVF